MKLPNGEDAIVEMSKLVDYCLDLEHGTGKHKARVFLSALNLKIGDAAKLREVLLKKAATEDALPRGSTAFGDRYTIDFELAMNNRVAEVRSSWIILKGELIPRLVTCFVR